MTDPPNRETIGSVIGRPIGVTIEDLIGVTIENMIGVTIGHLIGVTTGIMIVMTIEKGLALVSSLRTTASSWTITEGEMKEKGDETAIRTKEGAVGKTEGARNREETREGRHDLETLG
jgi:hypothetical protein